MVGKNSLAVAMVLAAFAGGVVSNWLLQMHVTQADAREPYRTTLDFDAGKTPPTFRTPEEQHRFQAAADIQPTAMTCTYEVTKRPQADLPTGTVAATAFHLVDERGKVRYTLALAPDQREGQPRLAVLDECGQVVWSLPDGRGTRLVFP